MARRPGTPTSAGPSVTEEINPRTTNLDRLSSEEVLGRILDEDAAVPRAVRAVLPAIAAAADVLYATLAADGRWFNLGAGSSGRIGVLDAAELPPTFGMPYDRVLAVLAGAPEALERAVEGAEDDPESAAAELERRGFGAADALVALSASGRTPFVLGGVAHAARVGARSIGITCAPRSPLASACELPIAVEVGPEVIAGSTRMKGALAEKMVLHALSTAVMVRLGRVRGNLMSEIRGTNSKLLERSIRIVARLAHVEPHRAAEELEAVGGSVPAALQRLGVPERARTRR